MTVSEVFPNEVRYYGRPRLHPVGCSFGRSIARRQSEFGDALILHSETNDSYTLQGTFSGLAFNTSQAVFLTLGQFNVSLLLTDFVQQPGTNIFVYQDKTGQTPYWVSSLTIDLDAQTFNAQATGIALAGLTNPFAVQLGTENGLGCPRARVQSPDGVNFQLTAGDGVNEPCQIDFPQMSQPSFFAGQTTTIQFQVTIPAAGNVDPSSVQLFPGQSANAFSPMGAPLCNLSANGTAPDGSGIYSCTASFSQDAPGPIPLMVEAAAGGNTLLSPGFSALAVGPMTQADVDAIGNVASTAASAAWDGELSRWRSGIVRRPAFRPSMRYSEWMVSRRCASFRMVSRSASSSPPACAIPSC